MFAEMPLSNEAKMRVCLMLVEYMKYILYMFTSNSKDSFDTQFGKLSFQKGFVVLNCGNFIVVVAKLKKHGYQLVRPDGLSCCPKYFDIPSFKEEYKMYKELPEFIQVSRFESSNAIDFGMGLFNEIFSMYFFEHTQKTHAKLDFIPIQNGPECPDAPVKCKKVAVEKVKVARVEVAEVSKGLNKTIMDESIMFEDDKENVEGSIRPKRPLKNGSSGPPSKKAPIDF